MNFDELIFDKFNYNTTVIINDVKYEGFRTGKANEGFLSSPLKHGFPLIPRSSPFTSSLATQATPSIKGALLTCSDHLPSSVNLSWSVDKQNFAS